MAIHKEKAPVAAQDQELQVFHAATSLPSTVITQWQFGDWPSLQANTLDQIASQQGRAQLAGIVAVAHYQQGDPRRGEQYLAKAREWGCSREMLARLMSSGVYNTLGRSALLSHQHERARQYLHQSVAMGMRGADLALLTPVRIAHQAMQLGIPLESVDNWNLLMSGSQQQSASSLADAQSIERDVEANSESPLIQRLMQHLNTLAQKLVREGKEMMLDDIHVFHEKDPFLPGKVALGLAYWVTEYPSGSALTFERCRHARQITQMLLDRPLQSWGIDFYLRALHKLNQAGVLEKCFSQATLVRLQQTLDWRDFVDARDYSLKNKPNNFYGVAYGIAYHRYQLGWDDSKAAECLLNRIVGHYQANAGEFGFADETEGHGRYDRYSLLLIAELAHHHREAGLPLTADMKQWLRASVDVVLVNLNEGGHGFQYGRSIGAYGDSAFVEILSAAAWFKVLKGDEVRMAYHFCCLATEKFLGFWWDEQRQSVNLWEDGRATEAYRGKNRILGESLSLLHQHLYTQYIWQRLGFSEADRDPQAFRHWLGQLPTSTLTWFEKGEYEYALLTYRGGDRLFNVPLVNGHEYHALSTYLPIPYSHDLIQGVPDTIAPLLTPKLVMTNGEEWMPVCWFQNVTLQTFSDGIELSWTSLMARITNIPPSLEANCRAETKLRFTSGTIDASYSLTFEAVLDAKELVVAFLPLSQLCEKANGHAGKATEYFIANEKARLKIKGFDAHGTIPAVSQSTSGHPPRNMIWRMLQLDEFEQPITLQWQLTYQ